MGEIKWDNRNNFVSASIHLKKAFGEMDKKRIIDFLIKLGGGWISQKQNPPILWHVTWEESGNNGSTN